VGIEAQTLKHEVFSPQRERQGLFSLVSPSGAYFWYSSWKVQYEI